MIFLLTWELGELFFMTMMPQEESARSVDSFAGIDREIAAASKGECERFVLTTSSRSQGKPMQLITFTFCLYSTALYASGEPSSQIPIPR